VFPHEDFQYEPKARDKQDPLDPFGCPVVMDIPQINHFRQNCTEKDGDVDSYNFVSKHVLLLQRLLLRCYNKKIYHRKRRL
jgi:hypothetical protein